MSANKQDLKYFLLALCSFFGLCIEIIYGFWLIPTIFGGPVQLEEPSILAHWTLSCLTWGIVAWLLVKYSKQKQHFDIFAETTRPKAWQWACVAACFLVIAAVSYLAWGGFKIIIEFRGLGPLHFVFQYVYYAFETILFSLIIIFSQKAGELRFKKQNIPYGGIFAALTWGLIHALTQGSLFVGLYAAVNGLVFGIVYLLLKRDVRKHIIISYLMFII